jgi:hypothetical protein
MKKLKIKTEIIGDYCYDQKYFQIRTYKSGDIKMEESPKQNIQLDKKMAVELINLLSDFIKEV